MKDTIQIILEAAREQQVPDGMDRRTMQNEIIRALSEKDVSAETRELALLSAWYLYGEATRQDDSEDLWTAERWAELFDRLCADAFEEPEEVLRGRKHWVSILRSFGDEDYDAIFRRLERLGGEEQSEYVWERVFAALGWSDESCRFYPLPLADLPRLKELQPSCFANFVRRLEEKLSRAAAMVSRMEGGTAEWAALAASGDLPVNDAAVWMRVSGTAGRPFPVKPSLMDDLYSGADRGGRIRLIGLLKAYLDSLGSAEDGEAPGAEAVSLAVRTAREFFPILHYPGEEKRSLYESCVLRVLEFMAEPSEAAFTRAMDLLIGGIPEDQNIPETSNDLVSTLGPHFLRMVDTAAVGQKEWLRSAELLESGSAYMKKLGATLLLLGIRRGYSPGPAVEAVRKTLQENPETSNSLAVGKDIEESEYAFSFNLPSPMAFGLGDKKDNDKDKFFSLRNLTGLLEMCQEPGTAKRLEIILESTDREKAGIGDHRGGGKAPGGPAAGPMVLGDAAELIRLCFDDEDRLEEIISGRAEELGTHYRSRLSEQQRGMIRSVFEDNDGETQSLYAVQYNRIAKDGFHWPRGPAFSSPEISFDYLAFYQPASGPSAEAGIYCGVYLHAQRIITFARRYDLPLDTLIRLIAVHELYHAFTQRRMCVDSAGREAYRHSHAGENPDYCRLEEAAADRVSWEWGKKNLPEDVFGKFTAGLLQPYVPDTGQGLPGYGEYPLLDEEALAWVPMMLEKGAGHVQPPRYRNAKMLLSLNRKEEYTVSRYVWEGMLAGIDLEDVGWFVTS